MSTDWFTSGFDPDVLPRELRQAYDYWLQQTDNGQPPLRAVFNPLALPAALLRQLAIFEISDRPGSGEGRFHMAGSAVIALHGTGLATAPLSELVDDDREDLVEALGEFFLDDWQLPIFTQVAGPDLAPNSTLSILTLPLRQEGGLPRLAVLVYHLDTPDGG